MFAYYSLINSCLWTFTGRCELYGDPHYTSFSGATFDFLQNCTYILVEEQSPKHHLTILVDNFYCVPGLQGSCVKDVIVKYQNNTAELSVDYDAVGIQVISVFYGYTASKM